MKKILYVLLKGAARLYLKRTKPYIIGITGSVGKTSCRMIIAQTLEQILVDTRVSTSPKNFNSEVGLCLSILEIENRSTSPFMIIWTVILAFIRSFSQKRYDVLVAEYGIDSVGDMDYLLSIAVPHMVVFTVLDTVHSMQLGSPDDILHEKSKLLLAAKEVVFLSVPSTRYLADTMKEISCDLLTYATHKNESEDADIRWRNRTLFLDEKGLPVSQFTIEQGKDSVISLTTNLLGETDAGYSSLGVECSLIVATRLGKKMPELESINNFTYTMQPGRMSVLEGQRGSLLIDSSYNAAPKSMRETIGTTINLRNELYPKFDLIYCLGDMRELGTFTEEEHRNLAAYVAQSADELYLVGEQMKTHMIDELEKIGYNIDNVYWFESSEDLGQTLYDHLPSREKRAVVLFKGSQNTIFLEEAIKPLLKNKSEKTNLARQGSFWKKKKVLSLLLLFCSFFAVGCGTPGDGELTRKTQSAHIPQVCFEQECFFVEIADDHIERQKGLMGRAVMDDDRGMLFVFDDDSTHRFWMKNTLISLDMLWLDKEGVIVHIEDEVQPCPKELGNRCPSYGPIPGVATRYVLEINEGLAGKYGINVGQKAIISL